MKRTSKVPAPTFTTLAITAETARAPIYEHFSGGPQVREIHNATGCKLEVEAVLVRSYCADPFRLALKLGDRWYTLAEIRPDDPAIRALSEGGHFVEYGPSPAERERQRRQEEETRKKLEAAAAEQAARRQHHEQLREQREARQRRAIEERRARM